MMKEKKIRWNSIPHCPVDSVGSWKKKPFRPESFCKFSALDTQPKYHPDSRTFGNFVSGFIWYFYLGVSTGSSTLDLFTKPCDVSGGKAENWQKKKIQETPFSLFLKKLFWWPSIGGHLFKFFRKIEGGRTHLEVFTWTCIFDDILRWHLPPPDSLRATGGPGGKLFPFQLFLTLLSRWAHLF